MGPEARMRGEISMCGVGEAGSGQAGMYRQQENNHHEWLDHTTMMEKTQRAKQNKTKNCVFAA